MTTVIAGDHRFDVDTENMTVKIIMGEYGRISVFDFTCDGFEYEGQPLLDYLLDEAKEIESENASDNYLNGQYDYSYDTIFK